MLVSKTIKNTGIIRKLFDKLCEEKLGQELTMVLYSSSRWSSSNKMFVRLKRTKSVIVALPFVLQYEREERDIDDDVMLPKEFASIINDSDFWRDISAAIAVLDPLCKCIGVLESDSAPLSLAYASFVYIAVRLSDDDMRFGLDEDDANHLLERLHYRWDRIYSPAHALAFFCDPFFFDMRDAVERKYGATALQIGKGSLRSQCREALDALARGDAALSAQLTNDFLRFSAQPHASLSALKKHPPRLIWGQLTEEYPALAPTLMQVYMAPASTAGVERNHKTGKRVLCARRSRCGTGKVERQLAIAHNGHFINRERESRKSTQLRGGGFESIIVGVASGMPEDLPMPRQNCDDEESDDETDDELLRVIASAASAEDILDDDIFPNRDDY